MPHEVRGETHLRALFWSRVFGGSSSHLRHIREGELLRSLHRKWHHQSAHWLAGSKRRDLQTEDEPDAKQHLKPKERDRGDKSETNLKIEKNFSAQVSSLNEFMAWWREKWPSFPSNSSVFIKKKKNFRKTQTRMVFSHSVSIWSNVDASVCSAQCVMLTSAGGGANRSNLHHQHGLRSASKAAASSPDWPSTLSNR